MLKRENSDPARVAKKFRWEYLRRSQTAATVRAVEVADYQEVMASSQSESGMA